jgi:hypothetical protein
MICTQGKADEDVDYSYIVCDSGSSTASEHNGVPEQRIIRQKKQRDRIARGDHG